ncbi:hypothetical protein ACFP47_09325 [Nesterenkonia lacusekhoensis]|uniref:Beta-lactamase regulating signal transducer with metallopeptidase domain n=1 Tax=Nesterenkonia lacusekhoensis TaxID=150832 RepID=A0ABS4SYW3_9MICC|nr:hypothetical protein [Nesterenkonia lacusekhoensis]MBP2317384.1 beta-lactamase regulating signal transducer with metallopeptidase domain [Nesterenkonia lacusekhoensis]
MSTSYILALGVIYAFSAIQYLLVVRLDREVQEMERHHQQAMGELIQAKVHLAKATIQMKKGEGA